jgi:hypothetical protein
MLSDSPLAQVNLVLLTIYSKSDRDDISSAEILNILSDVLKP